MISRYLLLALFVLISGLSYAQPSIYEFDYYFDVNNVREHYNAFLVRNDDGTGFIRVRFPDEKTQTPIVVNMLMSA